MPLSGGRIKLGDSGTGPSLDLLCKVGVWCYYRAGAGETMRQTVIALSVAMFISALRGKGAGWCDTSVTALLTFASCQLGMATKAMLISFVRCDDSLCIFPQS